MAQRVITQLVDDIDGKEIEEGSGETVSFALDGVSYEIDLSSKNAEKLRGALASYVAAGRKVGGKTSRRTRAAVSGPTAAEVREWARSNGHEVPDRGRIPADVREAFDAAN